jgi:hypothetical protein
VAEEIQSILIDKYKAEGKHAKAHNIDVCGSYLLFRRYRDPQKTTKVVKANLCHHPLCPFCAWRKHSKNAMHIAKALHGMDNLYLLTLTIDNTETIAKPDISLLIKNSTHMMRKVMGCNDYVATIEITNKGKGFHPHVHAIVYMPNWSTSFVARSMAYWRKEWGKINNGVHGYNILQIEKIDTIDGAVQEVTKYITKVSTEVDGIPLKNAIHQLSDAIHGVRQLRSAGEIKKRIADAKKTADADDKFLIKSLEWYGHDDIVAQWVQGHYSLRIQTD